MADRPCVFTVTDQAGVQLHLHQNEVIKVFHAPEELIRHTETLHRRGVDLRAHNLSEREFFFQDEQQTIKIPAHEVLLSRNWRFRQLIKGEKDYPLAYISSFRRKAQAKIVSGKDAGLALGPEMCDPPGERER
jgi:hypothetical protein